MTSTFMNVTYSSPLCGWLYQLYNFLAIINWTEQNELKKTDIPATFLLSGQEPAQHSHCSLGESKCFQKESPFRLRPTKEEYTSCVRGHVGSVLDTQSRTNSDAAPSIEGRVLRFKVILLKCLNVHSAHISSVWQRYSVTLLCFILILILYNFRGRYDQKN